jgi:serralysin
VEATRIDQGATGNAYIDGLLSGDKWSGQISFSFPDAASRYPTPYGDAEPTTGFAQASLQLREAARSILLGDNVFHGNNVSTYGSFWDVIAPSIVESGGLGNGNAGTNSGLGDIRLAESTKPPTAWAYYPSGQPP